MQEKELMPAEICPCLSHHLIVFVHKVLFLFGLLLSDKDKGIYAYDKVKIPQVWCEDHPMHNHMVFPKQFRMVFYIALIKG